MKGDPVEESAGRGRCHTPKSKTGNIPVWIVVVVGRTVNMTSVPPVLSGLVFVAPILFILTTVKNFGLQSPRSSFPGPYYASFLVVDIEVYV